MTPTNAMIEAAKRYALSDPSDPFALKRALCHLNNKVATYANLNGQPAYYDAEPYTETRSLPDGTEYPVTVYRNRIRP